MIVPVRVPNDLLLAAFCTNFTTGPNLKVQCQRLQLYSEKEGLGHLNDDFFKELQKIEINDEMFPQKAICNMSIAVVMKCTLCRKK